MKDMSVLLPVWTQVGPVDSDETVEWVDYIGSIYSVAFSTLFSFYSC